MNLTSPTQVKTWCIENGFHPNKVLGQNFLIDQNALKAIVDAGLEKVATEPDAPISVLEIGPGLGVLTEEMLKRGCQVTAIEKDPVLAERLAASLGNPEGLSVIAGDALTFVAPHSPLPTPHSPLPTSPAWFPICPTRPVRASSLSLFRRSRFLL